MSSTPQQILDTYTIHQAPLPTGANLSSLDKDRVQTYLLHFTCWILKNRITPLVCHAISTTHVNVADSLNNVVILNNFFGRQFNSLNDVSVNPRNGEIYFTDVMYAYLQDYRPAPGLPNQVYRFNMETGLVQVVADGINMPNGRLAMQNGLLFHR